MKVTYIFHSGFLLETSYCYYIFDYYNGEIPLLNNEKTVYVFSSHFHKDHYNPKIFNILKEMNMKFCAVLSGDINPKLYPENTNVLKVYHSKSYILDNGDAVKTLISTDSGVAFVLETKEGTVFHSGDLNDWCWDGEPEEDNRLMTLRYRSEIDKIKNIFFDAAFVPLDPRLEKNYADGLLYFLKPVNVKTVFPMHYWGRPQIIEKFLGEHPEYKNIIKYTENVKGAEI